MSNDVNFTGATLLDEQREKIGDVRDVIYEGADQTPTWLVVKPGLLRAEHFVPSQGAYRTENDELVVPYTAEQVKSSPKAKGAHALNEHDRALLGEHYHLTN